MALSSALERYAQALKVSIVTINNHKFLQLSSLMNFSQIILKNVLPKNKITRYH